MPDAAPRISPDVVARRVGDQVVVVHLGTNEVVALNETAARLWELLAERRSRPEIEDALAGEYEVDRDALRAELDATLERLAAAGIVLVDA